MCHFPSCCFNCTLKKGTLIIGYFSLAVAALVLIGLIGLTSQFNVEKEDEGEANSVITSFFIVAFIVVIGKIIVSILLIIGATKGRRQLLLPWIITEILGLTVLVIGYFLPGTSDENSSKNKASKVISEIVGVVLEIGIIVVVVSHSRELKRNKSSNAPMSA